ncbi:MAG: sulfatase-like hydrolase/transferase [Bacteroidota bacterium]
MGLRAERSVVTLTPEQPNIVFIFSDDLSFRDLSVYGQTEYHTPHLDSLARVSTRFTQAYTAAPECAPSRGCLLTGLNVGRSPIKLNSSARGFEWLPDSAYTFAEMLKGAGYETAVIGKWGLGYHDSPGNPNRQGFDYHFGYLTHYEAHSYFPTHLYENGKQIDFAGNQDHNIAILYEKDRKNRTFDFESMYDEAGKLTILDPATRVYTPDLLDQKIEAFLEEDRKNPFLLYFTTNLPHGPVIVDDMRQLTARKDIDIASREWGAMVERLDISVGKLIAKLKAEGLYDNTMIVFASDNGYAMHRPHKEKGKTVWGDDPWLRNKGPFYGGKFTAREAGMRVPMMIRYPAQSVAKIVEEPVWLVDLFPTFCELSGQAIPDHLDGYSLVPLLTGEESGIPKRAFYFFKRNEQAVRKGPWYAFREHPDRPVQLFLLAEDQTCDRDLAAYYPEVSAEMAQIMDQSHEPHPWYWNPGESEGDYAAKQAKAAETGQVIKRYRPNGMDLMPWERK